MRKHYNAFMYEQKLKKVDHPFKKSSHGYIEIMAKTISLGPWGNRQTFCHLSNISLPSPKLDIDYSE